MNQQVDHWDRRAFLRASSVVGAAQLVGLHSHTASAEPPPETTRLRLYKFPSTCLAPQFMAEELLRAEGFTDVQYLDFPEGVKRVQCSDGRLGTGRRPGVRCRWPRGMRVCGA